MNKLMIDFETLGITDKPVLATIGAVVFNQEGIQAEMYIKVDVEDAQNHGLDISASTFLWWLEQNEQARMEMVDTWNRFSLKEAMKEVYNFYVESDCQEVYGNGALSDIVWANNAFKAVGMESPWTFREERCFRTLKAVLPHVKIDFEGTAHNPLDDAKWQALYLIEAIKHARIAN